jgi:hypothetical protein
VIRLVGIERSATHALKIFEIEAELGQNFFVGNTLATVEGGAGSDDLTSFFLRDWLIVQGGIGETASHRISHHFEQMNDGGNLAGSQTLDQIVGLLFFVGGSHQELFAKSVLVERRMFGALGEGWVPPSRACRREPLLAENAGFLFFRIFEFSDIFLGERAEANSRQATLQLGTNLAPKPGVGVGTFWNGEVLGPMESQWVSIALLGS